MSIRRALVGHPRYAMSCVVRVAILWIAIRAAALFADLAIAGPVALLFFACVIVAIVLIDARATRELVFMRNLGLPAGWLITLSGCVFVVLEILVHVLA